MENKSAEEVLAPIEIPQDMRSAAWDYAMAKMLDGFNLNTCNQHSKDQFYDHYYLYIISTHGDNQWNAALEEAEKKAQKIYAVSKWVTAVTVEDIDNLKK